METFTLSNYLPDPPQSPSEGASYEEMKKVAKSTGDAAKEWLGGSSSSGSSVSKQAKRDSDNVLEATKRAVEDNAAFIPGESSESSASRDEKSQARQRKTKVIDDVTPTHANVKAENTSEESRGDTIPKKVKETQESN